MKKKVAERRFVLPDDRLGVKAIGYIAGINMGCLLQSIGPTETIESETPAQEACTQYLDQFEVKSLTNSPALFRRPFVEGYQEGCQFGVFAASHGLSDIFAGVQPDVRNTYLYFFAQRVFSLEVDPIADPHFEMVEKAASARLMEIHTQYLASNL